MIGLTSKPNWWQQLCNEQRTQATNYEEQAFWQGLSTLFDQQIQRQKQLQGQIDGQLWDHQSW